MHIRQGTLSGLLFAVALSRAQEAEEGASASSDTLRLNAQRHLENLKRQLTEDGPFPNTVDIAGSFGFMMEDMIPSLQDCSVVLSTPKPTITACKDLSDTLEGLTAVVNYNVCALEADTSGNLSMMQSMGDAFEAFVEVCAPEPAAALASVVESPFCVEKFEEGDYDGLLGRARTVSPDFGSGVNQYAWATAFNEDINLGIIIHSTGTPGALRFQNSLPTFTIRDQTSQILFEGIYGDPVLNNIPPITGLRSAVVLGREGDIVSVLASSIGLPNGVFLKFEFDLSLYRGEPIPGIVPVDQERFAAPSVRAATKLNENFVLYAPLFDIVEGPGFPFLKILDLRTFSNVPATFVLTDDSTNATLPGLLWDFECADEGLCFANFVASRDPTLFIGDEESIPQTTYFPVALFDPFIETLEADMATALVGEIKIPTTVIENDFSIAYSAQSLEPVGDSSSVVCTLSGFLFRLGQLSGLSQERDDLDDGSSSQSIFPFSLDNRPSNDEILEFFELGQPQQCNICTGVLPEDEERRLKKRERGGFRRERGNRQKKVDGDKSKKKSKNKKNKNKKKGEGCQAIDIEGQPSTTAYIWAVEECGGKIFIGTYDIASVLFTTLIQFIVGVIARRICDGGILRDTACSITGKCTGDAFNDEEVCRNFVVDGTIGFLNASPVLFQFLQSTLASFVFEEDITPAGLGFDLYYIEVDDLFDKKAKFLPVTQNGFRELTIAREPESPRWPFSFPSDAPFDDAIRNMVCHKDPINGDRLVIGSAVFTAGSTSNTYVLNPGCALIE